MKKLLSAPAVFPVSLLTLFISAQAGASVLLEDDQLTLTYKNYYFNEYSKDNGDGRIWGANRNEWIHAAEVHYQTGFIGDWLQLEYGLLAADELRIGSSANNVTNLPDANQANGFDPDGLLGTQTAYVTTRYRGDGFTFSAGGGKKARESAIYMDSSTRIQNATSVGYDLNADIGKLKLYYTELHKLSQRDQDDWGDDIVTYSGEKIDALRYYGGEYAFDLGLTLELAEAESEDYIKERKARASYRLPLANKDALLFQATYGTMQDAGNLYETDGVGIITLADHDYAFAEAGSLDARYYELSAGYRWPGYSLSLNYSDVSGDDWNHNLARDEFRLWDTSSRYSWTFYGLEDEQAVSVLGSVDFEQFGLPNLNWYAGVWYSDQARGYNDFKRYEFTQELTYSFTGELQGLSLRYLNSFARAQGELDGVNRIANPIGPAALEDKNVNRLYLTYTKTF